MSESLEALEDLFDLLCEREHTNSEHCFYLKLYNTIKKDLELSETLRPHLINVGIGKFDDVKDNELLHLKLTLSGKEYNTIKGWLENDK